MSDEIETLREQVTQLRETRAAHAEQIKAVSTRVDTIAVNVEKILGYMERTKGSWRTLVVLGGLITALVEGIHQIVGFFHHG